MAKLRCESCKKVLGSIELEDDEIGHFFIDICICKECWKHNLEKYKQEAVMDKEQYNKVKRTEECRMGK